MRKLKILIPSLLLASVSVVPAWTRTESPIVTPTDFRIDSPQNCAGQCPTPSDADARIQLTAAIHPDSAKTATPDVVQTSATLGSTIPQPEKTVNQRRAERGISSRSTIFVPKGQWVFGGKISY